MADTSSPENTEKLDARTIARANLFWLILLVGMAASSLYLLVDSAGKSTFGLALFSLTLILFWFMEDDGSAPRLWQKIFERLSSASTIFLVLCAAACSVAAAWMGLSLEERYSSLGEEIAVWLWIAGGLIIFLMHCKVSWAALYEWWREHRRDVIFISIITLLAALLRFYLLDSIPNMIDGDEGWTGMVALKKFSLAPFMYTNPFSFAEGFGRRYLDVFADAIAFFGQNKFGLRFVPALGGTLAIPAVYILARHLLGRARYATVAALLMTFAHAHIHFSRTSAVGYQQGNWLTPLELFCFLKGLEGRNRNWIVMSGLLLGLHFNVYFSAQLIIPMVTVYLIMASLITPPRVVVDGETTIARPPLPIRENLRNLPWFFGSILVFALPALFWAFKHPDDFGARWAKEGVFQSGWLLNEIANTGQPAVLILLGRFLHVCETIFILPFQDFYWAPAPVLDLITAVFFVVGAFLALRRTRDPKILLLNGWFWSGVVAIGIFAIPPSADSYRLSMVLPAMCILAALGWAHITSLAERLARVERRTVLVWMVVSMFLVAALNLKIYFIDFGRSCLYSGNSFSTRRASLLGDYLREQPAFDRAFLLNDDFAYGIFPSTDYLSGSIPVTNIGAPFALPDTHGSTLFFIVPSREPERVTLTTLLPGGTMTRITECGKLMFLAYRIYIP